MSLHHLHSRVRVYRKKAGFSQRELADLTGTTRNHISGIECKNTPPSALLVMSLSIALNVTPEDLFPHAYENLKKRIRHRALNMHGVLQGDARPVTSDKLNALEAVFHDGEDI